MGDGVDESGDATLTSQDLSSASGGIFLGASHGVRRTSAPIPHPGMADRYGCPNLKFCQTHTHMLTIYSTPPYSTPG